MKIEKEPKEYIEDVEEVVVEVVKAPFKIAKGLFDWITGERF